MLQSEANSTPASDQLSGHAQLVIYAANANHEPLATPRKISPFAACVGSRRMDISDPGFDHVNEGPSTSEAIGKRRVHISLTHGGAVGKRRIDMSDPRFIHVNEGPSTSEAVGKRRTVLGAAAHWISCPAGSVT